MLDPEIPDERREQITAEARHADRVRRLAQARHGRGACASSPTRSSQRTEADYRFFRFETEGALLDELEPQPADRGRRAALPDLQGRPAVAGDRSAAAGGRRRHPARPAVGAARRRPTGASLPRRAREPPEARAGGRGRPRRPTRRRGSARRAARESEQAAEPAGAEEQPPRRSSRRSRPGLPKPGLRAPKRPPKAASCAFPLCRGGRERADSVLRLGSGSNRVEEGADFSGSDAT